MPIATRAEKRAEKERQFKFIFEHIMQINADDILYKIFDSNQFKTLEDIVSTRDDNFENLQYVDENGNKISPLGPLLLRLRILKAFYFHLMQKYNLSNIDWKDGSIVDSDEFDNFRVTIYDPEAPTNPKNTSPSSTNAVNLRGIPVKPPMSLAAEFRRGVKREKSAYAVLKDERAWNSWKRKTIATMNAHGCQNVANPNYQPNSLDESLLLREQNNFMYDVFATILQTTMGAHYIAVHEDSRDAQLVWKDYTTYMKTSTSADMQIEELMSSLTSLRLSQNYRGTTQKFIIDWLDKMMQYEKLTPLDAHFTPTVKKAMLQNAVQEFKVFKQVKTQEQMEVARGSGPLIFSQYVSLLLNVSSAYDKKFVVSQTSTQKRLVNMYEQDQMFTYEYEKDDEYSWDVPIDDEYFGSYIIQASDRTRRFRPSLPRSVWESLSKLDQQTWDQISAKGKWNVIKGLRQTSSTRKNNSAPNTGSLTQQENSTNHLSAQTHKTNDGEEYQLIKIQSSNDISTPSVSSESMDANSNQTTLINAAKSIAKASADAYVHPADLRRFLSEDHIKRTSTTVSAKQSIPTKLTSNSHIHYKISRHQNTKIATGALVDRGANGGMAGDDLKIIAISDRKVDVSGIDNHELTGLKIVTAGGVVKSQRGEIIVILNQFAYIPGGKTILSCPQLEAFGMDVDDRSKKLQRGEQCITTLEGFVIPMNFVNGLPYIPIRPFTNAEWNSLPHVILTSDEEWDPSIIDGNVTDDEAIMNNIPINPTNYDNSENNRINSYGMPIAVNANLHLLSNDSISDEIDSSEVQVNEQRPSRKQYEKYKDYFLHVPLNVIQKTFDATTQFARSGWITGHIRNTIKAPFPAMNVIRRNESVATDTIFSDTPAVDDGSTCAQIFVGLNTKFCSAIGMKSDSQFVHALQDTIRKHGAMDQLVTDGGNALISHKVHDVLRHLCIKNWHSEPYYQHQNAAERRYNNIKANMNTMMNKVGAPAHCWLLCLHYVIFIMNRTALESLDWRTPYEKLYGNTPDISMIYRFKFFDQVYVKRDESRGGKRFPSLSNEILCRFVGFSEHVGHNMTYIVLTDDTQKLLYRSRVKLASVSPNLRIQNDSNNGESNNNSDTQQTSSTDDPRTMATINFDDVIDRTYLTPPNEDGTRRRMKIIEQLDNIDIAINSDPATVKFRASNDDETITEVITYQQILDKIEFQDGDADEWHFKAITNHKGPLKQTDPDYKGSSYNVCIDWENGETTWEPLTIIARSDPVTCAIYARDNNLLHLPGWTRFKRLAQRQKRLIRLVNQAKLKSFRNRPVFKFGVQIPRSHQHAMELDKANGNQLWKEAEEREFKQIDEYNTFLDLGVDKYPGSDYKKIKVHLVYDCKPTLKRKARLVANGNLTETPIDSIYSSVVSLRGLKTTIFIAELNGFETWSTDVGNAYLEAFTDEKIFIIAGDEFGSRAGHTLVVSKALYGLKSSGKRWWERCSEILADMGFIVSKAEDDIWLRKNIDHYEYIARYVDDEGGSKNRQQSTMGERA